MAQVLSTNVSAALVDFPAADASMQYYRFTLESSGIRLAHVIHDKTWGFSAKVLEISGFDPIVEYHIIDFVDTSDHPVTKQGESPDTAKVE